MADERKPRSWRGWAVANDKGIAIAEHGFLVADNRATARFWQGVWDLGRVVRVTITEEPTKARRRKP